MASQGEGDMRRIASFGRAAAAAFCVATLLTACLPGAIPPAPRLPPEPSETSSSETASVSPPETETPAPTETPEAEWKTYTTANEQLEFDYPPDWTIRDRAVEAAPGGVFVEVSNNAGKAMAALRTNIVIAAECTEKIPYFLMDSQELPALAQGGVTPRFVFEGRAAPSGEPGKTITMAYGITSAAPPAGSTACPIFHFFVWPGGGAMFGGVHTPTGAATGTPTSGTPTSGDTPAEETPDEETPDAYAATSEYDDIRQMITSLRPAEK
jgi:hypothetical protein